MEHQHISESAAQSTKAASFLGNRTAVFTALGIAAALILGVLLFMQGYVVAATVNGTPISRISVIKELEAQAGKQALESRIKEILIKAELAKSGVSVAQEEIDVEMQKIEAQVQSQGGTLADALAAQGMTAEKLRTQIAEQKQIEKLLADKVQVSDEEVAAYIKEQKLVASPGESAKAHTTEVKEQMRRQKMSDVAQAWLADLKTQANVKYYVDY